MIYHIKGTILPDLC